MRQSRKTVGLVKTTVLEMHRLNALRLPRPSHKKRLTIEVMDAENKSQSTINENSAKDALTGEADGPLSEDDSCGDATSYNGDAPSREDFGGRSGATERASILSNDSSGLIVKLFERGIPVIISVSSDIAGRAALSGLSIDVGHKMRVPIFENADKAENIFSDI